MQKNFAKTRVILIGLHPDYRDILALLINRQPDMVVMATADTVLKGLELARQTNPDIALIQIKPWDHAGLDGIRQLSAEVPETGIIGLCGYENEVITAEILSAGAHACHLIGCGFEDLADDIRKNRDAAKSG